MGNITECLRQFYYVNFRRYVINIDYYTVFLIPALISARVDRISLSPKGEG